MSEEMQEKWQMPVVHFARKRIDKTFRKLGPWMDRTAGDFTDVELHALRIVFKRLRYTCEFFRPLMGDDAAALLRSFVAFQDCLGMHQDAVTASRVLSEIVEELPSEDRSQAFLLFIGGLLQMQREAQAAQRGDFAELWRSAPLLVEQWNSLRAPLKEAP